jgi:hypothetical protein
MIYVDLKGRIGNQLFIYAFAENLRLQRGRNERIVINDFPVLQLKWINSLEFYPIENVEYVHTKEMPLSMYLRSVLIKIAHRFTKPNNYQGKYRIDTLFRRFWSFIGITACENGFLNIPIPSSKNVYVTGYFQSPKYFLRNDDYLCKIIRLDNEVNALLNEDINKITQRNTVCISIKIEHNVGSPIYDVCGGDYWERAIKYITERVDNPLFFICSDNVEYVKKHLIDTQKYDVICQDKALPVHLSLAIMGLCKHFIIGNTSFGWWAQHISTNTQKIVVAPSPWVRNSIPFDIYEDNMVLLDVTNYVNNEKR